MIKLIRLYKRIVTPSTIMGTGIGIIIGASTRNEYFPIVLIGCLYITIGLWAADRRRVHWSDKYHYARQKAELILNGENDVSE